MKKILFITFFFPPMSGGGVLRTVKFIKHLKEFGYQTTVLTGTTKKYWGSDPELLNKIPKNTKILRAFSLSGLDIMRIFNYMKRQSSSSVRSGSISSKLKNLSNWFFIPDPYAGWIPFAILKGLLYIDQVDLIFSTSPPNSSHLIAFALHKLSGKPWIADFRDPWVDRAHFSFPTKAHKRLHRWLEQRTLRNSSKVITINKIIRDNFIQKSETNLSGKIVVIPNGFDPDDFNQKIQTHSGKLKIVYTGSLTLKRSAVYFLQGIHALMNDYPETKDILEVHFYGFRDSINDSTVKSLDLAQIVHMHDAVSYQEAITQQLSADVLLLIIYHGENSETISTGKIFEYIGARKPILALIPSGGAAAEILRETNAGIIVSPTDIEAIKNVLYQLICDYRQKRLEIQPNEELLSKFTRKELTRQLVEQFEMVL